MPPEILIPQPPMSLKTAIESRDLAQIHALLKQGAAIDRRFEDNYTALMLAAAIGEKPMLRVLVKAGANVNLKNSQGDTALVLAAQAGHNAICEYLNILSDPAERQRAAQILADRAPSGPSPQEQVNALVAAAAAGELNSVLTLLGKTVDINSTSNRKVNSGQTAVYAAARNGHIEVVERLIEAGSDLNCTVKEDDPWTGVERLCPQCNTKFIGVADRDRCPSCDRTFYASQPAYDPHAPRPSIWDSALVDDSQPGIRTTKISPKALQAHRDPLRPPKPWRDHTPLMTAVRRGHLSVVQALVKAGANLSSSTRYEQSPLHTAVRLGQTEIANCLIAGGAVLDRFEGRASEAKTPLMIAIEQQAPEMIEILLQAGVNVNVRGEYDNTAISLAAELGYDAIVKRLQAAGANQEGLEAISLRAAAEQGDIARVRVLLAAGVDPNQPDFRDQTALIQAASQGQTQVVEVLLAAGAAAKQNNHLYSPLIAATYYGHVETVKCLLEAGADVNWESPMLGNALDCAQGNDYEEIVDLLLAAGAINAETDDDDDG